MRWLLAALLLAGPAAAEIRPVPRPSDVVILSPGGTTQAPPVAAVPASPRPVARMPGEVRALRDGMAALRAALPRVGADGRVQMSMRPGDRPEGLVLAMGDSLRPGGSGGGPGRGLCGRDSIAGERIGDVRGPGGCGIEDAVRVTRVGGLDLVAPTRMECDTARALDDWAREGVRPIVGRTGGGAVALRTAAGYACRGRNNEAGARLSEHASGRAIDIAAIALADGSELSVLGDWGGARGATMRALWQAACERFGTVLGPDSDAYHQDHFHLDTAQYRSGSYCR